MSPVRWLCVAAALVACSPQLVGSAPRIDREQLLFQVETLDEQVLASSGADRLFNPASVVKVGTTIWALDRLGSGYRFTTRVGYRGVWDRQTGTVAGTLVVEGGGDPDFHKENVMLIARQLNRLGIVEATQGLELHQPFTMGWEKGAEGRSSSEEARHSLMEQRLLSCLDVGRWDRATFECWHQLCERRALTDAAPPSVKLGGQARQVEGAPVQPLLVHRSNPLWMLLKRFNVYSNNDIIRLADVLGGPSQLQAYLRTQLAATPDEVQISTASGELRNRMSARSVIRLLRLLQRTTTRLGLTPNDLLPTPGCDPGPVPRLFPRLATSPHGRQLACKTGTLRHQDGGVAVLSGIFPSSSHGLVLCVVAATQTGDDLTRWRRTEQSWLLDLLTDLDGLGAEQCGQPLVFSDTWSSVVTVAAAAPAHQAGDAVGNPRW